MSIEQGKTVGMGWGVHVAVWDYLSSLINERSQPGKGGMAVTSHDLMVAAKTAGQKCECSAGVERPREWWFMLL